jgi:biopolymer transport protein TolR
MRANRTRAVKLFCSIDATPFVRVGVILAAIFLLTVMIVVESPRRGALDLARVDHPKSMQSANREGALVIAVLRDNSVWFGTARLMPDELPSKIQEGLSHGAERKVYIKADGRAPYGAVAAVLNGVRAAGVEKVCFLVDQRPVTTSGR